MLEIVGFLVLGIMVGTFGTLIGAGGGFILTPILLFLYPSLPPSTITAISMTTVFFNSSSGTFAYTQMKKVDFKTGIVFAIATLPGSILGTWFTSTISKSLFNMIFGGCMLLFAVVVIMKSKMGESSAPYAQEGMFRSRRKFTDTSNHEVSYSFNMLIGIFISVFVGFISGMLGIGGGIVHVPALVFLGFPAHFATATSHFVLSISSFTSLIVHIADGSLNGTIKTAISIGVGAIIGAQLGARLSKKIKGSVLMICLATALILVGIRILFLGIWG